MSRILRSLGSTSSKSCRSVLIVGPSRTAASLLIVTGCGLGNALTEPNASGLAGDAGPSDVDASVSQVDASASQVDASGSGTPRDGGDEGWSNPKSDSAWFDASKPTQTPDSGTVDASSVQPSCEGYQIARWPVDLNDVQSLAPIGLLVPPDHTFPSPHMGIATKKGTAAVRVYAPAAARATRVSFRDYDEDAGASFNFEDVFFITFEFCGKTIQGYVGLMSKLTHPGLLNAMKACVPVSLPGDGTYCQVDVDVTVAAGEELGTVRGGRGIDVGFRDYRLANGKSAFANPERFCSGQGGNVYARCHTACALEYLVDSTTKTSLLDLVLDSTESVHRTEAPRCGTVFHDVVGSAQGHWFQPGNNAMGEGPHLYLGPDPFLANVYAFSIGTTVTDVTAGLYRYVAAASGSVNPPFANIKDDAVYCFDNIYRATLDARDQKNAVSGLNFLVQRRNAGASVAVEKRMATSCGNGPWTMGAGAVVFDR